MALGLLVTGAAATILPVESASAATRVATTIASMSWGDRATVTGATSTVSGVASPHQEVRTGTLQRLDATGAWTDVKPFQTDLDGRFVVPFDQSVAGTQTFRVLLSTTATAYSVNSARFAYSVAKQATPVTADLSASSVTQNGEATISGTVGSGYANRVVQIHRRPAGSTTWTRVATSAPLTSDRYEVKVPTTTVGSYDLRAYTVATDVAAAGTSAAKDLKVTPQPRSLMAMDLTGIAEGPVTRDEFKQAFGLPAPLGSTDNRQYDDTTVENGWLRTTFAAGTMHSIPTGNNGAVITPALPEQVEEATISYRIRFSSDFDWSLGGKLPGLSGVAPGVSPTMPTGGKVDGADSGWSGRVMWLGPKAYGHVGSKANEIAAYMYHPGQSSIYGDNEWTNTAFEGGRTHTVTLRHKMNTVGQNDGILQVWIDGNLVVDRHDYVYRTRSDVKIGHLMWHLFRGGNTAAWAGSRDGYVEISGLEVTTP